ncbi:MAG TPA: endolytic transglycosylase MltG [Candidatus Paceibacterota bacterium]
MLPIRISKRIAAAAAILLIVVCIAAGWLLSTILFAAPSASRFAGGPLSAVVDKGQNARSVAQELKASGAVRSAFMTQNLILFFGGENKVKAGYYQFDAPESAFQVAKRIVEGDFGYTPVRLTIPEGSDSKRIAMLAGQKFPSISTSTLLQLAVAKEGYLFPETYFFSPIATPEEIIKAMDSQFKAKIKPYEAEIASSTRSLDDIIKLASILEREVQTDEDMKKVAYLLLQRMERGMALQVDATLMYVTGRGSADLTLTDLRADGDYNSYTRKGLPPTPIGNPGIRSIEAALRPEPNDYVFYLSDKDGITHFSKTYDQHLKLKAKYIDSQR